MFGLIIKATQGSSRYTVTGLSYDLAAIIGGLMPLFAILVSRLGKFVFGKQPLSLTFVL